MTKHKNVRKRAARRTRPDAAEIDDVRHEESTLSSRKRRSNADTADTDTEGNLDENSAQGVVERVGDSADNSSSSKKQKNSKSDDTNDAFSKIQLSKAVATAKPFILHRFASVRVQKGETCDGIWDDLAGSMWQEDVDVLLQALSSNLDIAKIQGSRLLRDENFLMKAFRSTVNKDLAKELWKILSDDVRCNPRVALAAVDRQVLALSSLPDGIKPNKACLLDGVKVGALSWKFLPKRFKTDIEFALATPRGHRGISFQKVAEIVNDKERLWREWPCKDPKSINNGDWGKLAPQSIRSDPDLMVRVISLDPCKTQYLATVLAEDLGFVQSVLDQHILSLAYFPSATYDKFPSILNIQRIVRFANAKDCPEQRKKPPASGKAHRIARAQRMARVAQWGRGQQLPEHDLLKVLPTQNWHDREFVLGWVSAGFEIPGSVLPEYLRDDEEVFILLSKHNWVLSRNSYREMSDRLRGDKSFIRRLLECSCATEDIMSSVLGQLELDEQLQIIAAAKSERYIFFATVYSLHYLERGRMVQNLEAKMQRQRREYQGFFKGFLCSVDAPRPSGCALMLLNQGTDSSIKRMVASFLDFPIGEQLGFLLEALRLRDDT
jgi:hypothetical protein